MQTKEDVSYGVIPLIGEGGNWRVFLINQLSRAGEAYWTFPKGHPEAGESPKDAALRELKEETNISLQSLDTTRMYEQAYSFMYEDMIINKKAVYFLGIASAPECCIQEDEVAEAGWFSFEEAYDKLTHEQAKQMLRQVQSDIEG